MSYAGFLLPVIAIMEFGSGLQQKGGSCGDALSWLLVQTIWEEHNTTLDVSKELPLMRRWYLIR